jgi:uncharacterized protein YpmS
VYTVAQSCRGVHLAYPMRSLFLLFLGSLCGVLVTVLITTLDPSFDAAEVDGAGGGNVSLTLDERALASIVEQHLPELPAFAERPKVEVRVQRNGVIRVEIGVGEFGVGVRSSIHLNPNIVDGELQIDVVAFTLGQLALPEQVAILVQEPIAARLNALAEGFEYRVTSIRTTDRKLTVEILI